jgi:hypothetical protein
VTAYGPSGGLVQVSIGWWFNTNVLCMYLCTLESGINVAPWINVAPG